MLLRQLFLSPMVFANVSIQYILYTATDMCNSRDTGLMYWLANHCVAGSLPGSTLSLGRLSGTPVWDACLGRLSARISHVPITGCSNVPHLMFTKVALNTFILIFVERILTFLIRIHADSSFKISILTSLIRIYADSSFKISSTQMSHDVQYTQKTREL